MPNSRYRSGYAFERRVTAHLEAEGYFCIEARGSHGPADIIAVKVGQVLAVQVKTDGQLSPGDWNLLRLVCKGFGMVPILACREGRRLALYELTGVRVAYDRNPPKRLFVTDQVAA